MPKISVGESTVALNCGSEKNWIGGGGVSKFCYLTVPKISVVESTVGLISGSEKVYGQEGGGEYQDFP